MEWSQAIQRNQHAQTQIRASPVNGIPGQGATFAGVVGQFFPQGNRAILERATP